MATVKITNTLTKVIADATGIEAVISPTGIPTPCTPVQSYIADMATITNGTLLIPAYNKVQMLSIPFGAYAEFEVTDAKEINYWENIKVDGAKVEVTEGILELVEPMTYTAVVFSGTGTEEDPYVPAFEAGKYYKIEAEEYVVLSSKPEDWGTSTDYFLGTKNVLPTNNVDGE